MAVVKCPNCKTQQFMNPSGQCFDCNQSLETECRQCHEPQVLEGNQSACRKCQTPFDGATKPPLVEEESKPRNRREKKSKKEESPREQPEPELPEPTAHRQKIALRNKSVKFPDRGFRLLTKLAIQPQLSEESKVLLEFLIKQFMRLEFEHEESVSDGGRRASGAVH